MDNTKRDDIMAAASAWQLGDKEVCTALEQAARKLLVTYTVVDSSY